MAFVKSATKTITDEFLMDDISMRKLRAMYLASVISVTNLTALWIDLKNRRARIGADIVPISEGGAEWSAICDHFKNLFGSSRAFSLVEMMDPILPPRRCGTEHKGRLILAVQLREHPGPGFTPKVYTFFCDPDIELFEGDVVVVDCAGAPQIAKAVVSDLSEIDIARTSKWVIGRVDMTAHENRLTAERRLRQLQAQLEEKVTSYEKHHKYLIMAERDPQIAAMYAEMQKLDSSLPPLPDGTKIAGQEIEAPTVHPEPPESGRLD